MAQKRTLRVWLWKWHFIAGLISIPFILLLSITGIIYLFKEPYEQAKFQTLTHYEVDNTLSALSFSEQHRLAQDYADTFDLGALNSLYVPSNGENTLFLVGALAHHKRFTCNHKPAKFSVLFQKPIPSCKKFANYTANYCCKTSAQKLSN